jgi:hypothetical protein
VFQGICLPIRAYQVGLAVLVCPLLFSFFCYPTSFNDDDYDDNDDDDDDNNNNNNNNNNNKGKGKVPVMN